jgi:hypothetical protein
MPPNEFNKPYLWRENTDFLFIMLSFEERSPKEWLIDLNLADWEAISMVEYLDED